MNEPEYGICRLATVPMRKDPADSAEMISQLLFGEHYHVLDTSEYQKWLLIKNEFDSYEGWIDKKQHRSISREFFNQINNSDYQISTDYQAELSFNEEIYSVSMGSVLPLLSNPLFSEEEKVIFRGKAKPIYTKLSRSALFELGKTMLNTPYYWGGRSSFGIDCSGFTQLIYRLAGVAIPRDSSQQILKGEEIEIDESMMGDLAFFTNQKGKMNHVGMIGKAGEIIHASGKVRIDKIDSNGIFNDEQNEYTHHLFKVKRYLPQNQ